MGKINAMIAGVVVAAVAGYLGFQAGDNRAEARTRVDLMSAFEIERTQLMNESDRTERAWTACMKIVRESERVVFAQFKFEANLYDDIPDYVNQAYHLGQSGDLNELVNGLGRTIAYYAELNQAASPSSIKDWATDDAVDRCFNL